MRRHSSLPPADTARSDRVRRAAEAHLGRVHDDLLEWLDVQVSAALMSQACEARQCVRDASLFDGCSGGADVEKKQGHRRAQTLLTQRLDRSCLFTWRDGSADECASCCIVRSSRRSLLSRFSKGAATSCQAQVIFGRKEYRDAALYPD